MSGIGWGFGATCENPDAAQSLPKQEEVMRFSVGDKVIHPGKGAGQIVAVRHQELVEGFEDYYVIEIPDRELTVSVPVHKAAELGVRQVMSRSQLTRVLATLRGTPKQLPRGYRKRQDQILEKLKTGHPVQVAEAVRDLTWHHQVAHATKKDGDLLARGRQFLAGELALLTDEEITAAREKIDAALTVATARASREKAPQRAVAA
jgi:CarD family transcriptional regulator